MNARRKKFSTKSFCCSNKTYLLPQHIFQLFRLLLFQQNHFYACETERSAWVSFKDFHIDHFLENLGDYSEEQGERFHQDISEM
ncbi:GSCOCG00011590001-RA-CDS [Cotesia congregata]|nr:GSCOCG00011590001-RA-CDS [Cotesia congregata]